MGDDKKTVEIAEDAPVVDVIKAEPPSKGKLKEMGWSSPEIESADKRGMVAKEELKIEDKPPEKKIEKPLENKPPEKKEELKSDLPDFTFKTPEQEKVFLDTFGAGTPHRAMYFRMKNERASRQKAETERDRLALELQLRKDSDVRARSGDPEPELDADGNVIDPDDKPLTMKQLKAMQKSEQDAMQKQQQEFNAKSAKVAESLKVQEEYAKTVYDDFEDTVKLATDLVNNLEKLSDPLRKSKAVKLLKDLQVTAASADQYGVDDYTASMIAYELGQLHPEYGQKKPEPNGAKSVDPKANGGLTPEQMKRIEENTQRRASSASLPGSSSGRRVISLEDVTLKDILKMTPEERYKFKKDHPERMTKFMRG